MTTKIQKWGNSLAVRLPKKIVVRLGLRIGNAVQIDEQEKHIVIKKLRMRGRVSKNVWKRFVIPTSKKKERVSEKIDEILYDKSS